MDMFRRQDRDRDGRVSRKEFIDGIIATSMFHSYKKCQFCLGKIYCFFQEKIKNSKGISNLKSYLNLSSGLIHLYQKYFAYICK